MKNEVSLTYDEKGDLLEIFLGKPTKGHYKDLGENILERIDEKTGETKGFMIHGFKTRTKHFKKVKLPLSTKKIAEITT